MRRTEALKIITRVLRQPFKDATPADIIYGKALTPLGTPPADEPKSWGIQVDMLALRIVAALPLTADQEQQKSPLAEAEDAKRHRDLAGEVGALMSGHARLTGAAWYPVRQGDLVHVAYEQAGEFPAFGETYAVEAGQREGGFNLRPLTHSMPATVDADMAAGMVGCFAVEDDPEPLSEIWMEAGPHRLTIIRDGRPVHIGGAR